MSKPLTTSGRRRATRRAPEAITVQEAADMVQVSPATIRRMIKAKKLRTVQALPVVRIELAYLRRRFGLGDPEK